MPRRWPDPGELPGDPSGARAKAEEWAVKHGLSSSEIESIEVRSVLSTNDTMYVKVHQEFGWLFGRALGLSASDISAQAAARVGSLAGGSDFLPWALLTTDVDCLDGNGNPKFGSSCVVKVGAGDGTTGWYGALDADGGGGGSSEYVGNIIDGNVDWIYCIAGDASSGCAGSNTAIDSLTGNKVGGTGTGIEERLAQGAQCDANGNDVDDFDEVSRLIPSGTPSYFVACGIARVIIIPIVSYDSVPVHDVTIRGWMLAYLDGYHCVGSGNCNGQGHWEVEVTIVDATYSQTGGFLDAFDPDSGIVVRRLVE